MKALGAEFFGTFGLVFCGTASVVVNDITQGALGVTGIALVFGAIVFAMVMTFASVSGAHLNPAVTLALAVAGRTQWKAVLPYVTAQLIGAVLASLLVDLLFPQSEHLGATLPSGAPWISFVLEIVLALLLMLVILGSSRSSTFKAAMAIGTTVGLEALFAGPVSGASMNPARSLAPALVSGHFEHAWIYLTAPLLGAAAAVPTAWVLMREPRGADT